MTEKELKKLNRAELLELLLVQTKETERLQKQLEKAEEELSSRYLRVMEAAQAAAQQYLDNIVRMEEETRLRCENMLAEAREEAAQIVSSAPKQHDYAEEALLEEIFDLLGKN